MAKKSASEQIRRSVLYSAIGNFCTKRIVRSDLESGKDYPVKATIRGTVFKSEVREKFSGILSVSHPTIYNTNTAAKSEEIIASLLPLIPKKRRVAALKKLSERYAREGCLDFKQSDLEEARVWVNSLKSLKSAKRAGAVSLRVEE